MWTLVTSSQSGFLAIMAVGLTLLFGLMGRLRGRHAERAQDALVAANDKAEASERQLDAILDHLADGVLTFNPQGLVQAMNPAAQRIFGYDQNAILGNPVDLLLPGKALAGLDDEAVRECTGRHADGSPLNLELSASRLTAGGRELTVAVLRDVSGRRLGAAIDALVQEVNQRVLQGEGMEALMPVFCRRTVEMFGLSLAWVGSKERDGAVAVQGCAGPAVLEGYLRAGQIRWDSTSGGRGPAGRAIRLGVTQQVGVTAADWTDLLAPFANAGLREGVAIPLKAGEQVLGAFSAYASRHLDEATLRRLEDLGARIGIAVQVTNDQRQLRLQGAAIGAAANAVLITDAEGKIEWVNDAFTRLSGYDLTEAVGRSPRLLRSGSQSAAFYHNLWTTIQKGEVWRGEIVERRKDGSLYTVEQTVTPMRGLTGAISHYVVVHEDITERKRAEEKIKFLSSYDALTGLPNRGLFRQRLEQAVARAEAGQQRLGVLFLDLDHFSRINDAMGHDLGDRLLAEMVARLSAATRSADTLARIGGDEFAVILAEKAAIDTAAILARRLISAVSAPYDFDGEEVHIGASVGIALFPEDGVDADQLIKNADVAMYRAIHEAPNGYRFFSTGMTEEMQARLTLERDLRRGLSRDEFILHYQPQLDILTGHVVGMEALIRWNHPEQGLVPPSRFIPLAEETGLIIPLGELVLRMACRQIRTWQDDGHPLVPVAVNVSAHQLRRPGLVELIRDIIDLSGIDTRWLELELTESGIMEDAQAAEHTLAELDEQGLKIAIDDFGTGYSSLSYLKRFPVHKLKIDQSFVRNLGSDEDDAAIARAIITLGHSLGMIVVSEGVETQIQLAYLRSQGCDVVQGFLFSRPVPPDQIPAFIASREVGK